MQIMKKTNCVERRYKEFVMLQGLVDSAYIRLITGDNTALPTSTEDLCKTEMVTLLESQRQLSHHVLFLKIFGDQAMPFPASEIPNFDLDMFQIIQLILTPMCTIISFAFTVPLVLKRIVEEKQQGVKVVYLP